MIRRIVAFTLILISCLLKVSALNSADISAECAVVISEQTGEVVFSKNAYQKRSMASTTKILTSLIAIESGQLFNEIEVTSDMVNVEGTSMGLQTGDHVSLDELVHGMLLQSGNDAANATALYICDSLEAFSDLMNNRAKQIGMLNSSFVTPSGLDSDEHYSTAYDMALLGREAISNSKFLSVCSKPKATLTYGNPPYRRTLYNHNKLLGYYDCVLGIKTGFTKKSGRCLVSYAKKDNVGLVAVTLNAPNDWQDHKLMLDDGFKKINSKVITADIPDYIRVVGSDKNYISITSDGYTYSYVKSKDVKQCVFIEKFLYAPVNAGDIVGYWDVYADDIKIKSIPIIASDSAY